MLFLLTQAGCGSANSTAGGAGAHRSVATQPVFAQSVLLKPVGGRVRVAVRPAGFVPLAGARVVPIGALVDTHAGVVALTSALPGATRFQTGRFRRGVFEVRQERGLGGLTNLVLRDNLSRRAACGGRARSQRLLGLLLGNATGHFRTTGRFAAATVRGTDWGVRDRCDGTLTVVRSGTVAVRDMRLGKTVLVHAGHTYLASAS